MDTTLRDGEQAEGISMMPEEKRTIAQRLLEVVKVDRIEVASARVSEGERRAVKSIVDYAESRGLTDRIEILGFVDGNRSVDWARSVGARVINLLTKGSLHHCREQLKKTHQQHIDDIRRTIEYGAKNGITFNVYLEDWSGGMIGCVDYVDEHIDALIGMPVKRIMLPDTLGLLSPPQVREFVGRIVAKFPEPALRFPRPRRLRPRHRQHAGSRDRGSARRARHGERHGRACRQRHSRRGRRGAARPRCHHDVGRRARAGRRQQARRSVLGPPRAAEQADRRRERVHADRRHPRRRRHEGQPVREPADARPIRAAPYLCDGQADGEGEPRLQPRAAQHHADCPSRSSSCSRASSSSAIRRRASRSPICRS